MLAKAGLNTPPADVAAVATHVPPVGKAARLTRGALEHNGLTTAILGMIGAVTITLIVLVDEHKLLGVEVVLYVNVWVPEPAAVGLKTVPVTPLPLHVPNVEVVKPTKVTVGL